MDTQVGNGECWTLADAAAKAVRAQPPRMHNYGQQIPVEEARVGDTVFFRTARFEGGRDDGGTYWSTAGHPTHTAVIRGVRGHVVDVYEQNVGGVKIVCHGSYNMADQVGGEVSFWRVLPRS